MHRKHVFKYMTEPLRRSRTASQREKRNLRVTEHCSGCLPRGHLSVPDAAEMVTHLRQGSQEIRSERLV